MPVEPHVASSHSGGWRGVLERATVRGVADDEALRFAERLLALVDATRYSATYKLATLLALIDVTAERTAPDGTPPTTLAGKEVARRVIELYWPQTIPYGAVAHGPAQVLSQAPQNDIPAKLASWRTAHRLQPGANLHDARAAGPDGWRDLEADLLAIVIGMPLAKLQRFGDGRRAAEDRFIYDFSWREEIGPKTVSNPDFDDTIPLRPGVGGWLIRLNPLVRPLVQTKWAAKVAARNTDLVDADRLSEFLFGAHRVSLHRLRRPLAEAQGHDCFYCAQRLTSRCDVDHFLPWSRHPDNSIDNLVAAHARCNNAKSASLASLHHLRHWLIRFQPDSAAFTTIAHTATATGWPRRADRAISAARATYLWLPDGTRLWQHGITYETLQAAKVPPLFETLA